MKILFLHRGYPGQFKYLAPVLAMDPNNLVLFITADERNQLASVNKLPYKIPDMPLNPRYPFLEDFQKSILHGQSAAQIAMAMKSKGIIPDLIYGHSWGSTLFMKDIFPNVPMICYFEWFEKIENSGEDFGGKVITDARRAEVRSSNPHRLIDLCSCDAGISPTEWQKQSFPKEFHHKINVIHDGIDTNTCKPDENAVFKVNKNGKTLEFSAKDEVITYATRGMEPYRGFPQFMEAVEKLLVKRPNAHFLIGGLDMTFYGDYLQSGTYKEMMLKKLKLDMNRVHFVGELSFMDYLKLLQISSAHVYSTVPFVLSWSILEAMSVGCCIVASDTAPVQEVIQDNYNGLLFDFYNVNQLVEKIEYALDNKVTMQEIRKNARKTVLDKYDIQKLYPLHLEYMQSVLNR